VFYKNKEVYILIKYLGDKNKIDKRTIDSLNYELNKYIYYFGNHFRYPLEAHKKNPVIYLKQILYGILHESFHNLNEKNTIVSNAYFFLNRELENIGYRVVKPKWHNNGIRFVNSKLQKEINYFKKSFFKKNFYSFFQKEFIDRLDNLKSVLKEYYSTNSSGLFVPNDMSFFENFSLQIFNDLHKPNFVFLHGLPGRYNTIDDNRAQYLIVWGNKIKENYINVGVDEKKIFVAGHPYYKKFIQKELKFDLSNILILTKSVNGAPIITNDNILSDRSNSVLYLYSVQTVLEKLNVKKVRFRPHPSESPNWYFKFIDTDFYVLDNKSFPKAIQESSLVIGPTSTTILESTYYGVNYVIYELAQNNIDLTNYKLAPPFDGSDSRIPVAKSEDDLFRIIKNKEKVNSDFFYDYIQTPFDISFIKNIIPLP